MQLDTSKDQIIVSILSRLQTFDPRTWFKSPNIIFVVFLIITIFVLFLFCAACQIGLINKKPDMSSTIKAYHDYSFMTNK